MRTREQLLDRLRSYEDFDLLYEDGLGYVVWRWGTGENLEVLFIETAAPGNGQGRELVRRMALRVLESGRRPYHSVFAFRLGSRADAGAFYGALGFHQHFLGPSVYGGDDAVLAWVAWADLLKTLGVGDG